MTDAIRELFELLTKKEKSGSDYTGRVTRVDGKTAYVQFDGSDITDTPVALSIGAKAGDSVRVRVADGRAWLVGNDDAPPNDSSEVGYELALTNALIRQLTTEQINGENGWINLLLGTFNYGNKLIWNGKELTLNGKVVTTSGQIGGWNIGSDRIYSTNSNGNYVVLANGSNANQDVLVVRTGAGTSADPYTWPFYVRADGTLGATKGKIGPWTLSSSGLSTTFFQLTENGVSEGTLLSFINKQDTTIKTEMYAGMLSFQSNTTSGVQFLSCSVIKDSGVKAGLVTLGNDSNYAVVNISGLDGSLYCSGTISENGTLLKDKYLGMVSDGNYYGMRIGNSDSAWVRTTSLGLIPYRAGGASSLGTSGWPFTSVYATTIYEGGTALSNKYAPKSGSDIRLKENVDECEVDSALEVIDRIQLHSFDWRKDGKHQQIGFVADELEEIDEHLADGGGYDADGEMIVKSVDTFYLQGYEIKAIQELHAEVRSLKAEIAELKEIIAVLMEGKK